MRRLTIAALAAIVGAGLFGFLGYRTGTTTASVEAADGTFELSLRYPQRTRGGLPSHWALTIERTDGQPLPTLEVATTATYLDLFDFNALTPEPDAITQHDDVTWTFEPSGDAAITIVLDVRTQPGRRFAHDATTTVTADGETIATLAYRTWVIP